MRNGQSYYGAVLGHAFDLMNATEIQPRYALQKAAIEYGMTSSESIGDFVQWAEARLYRISEMALTADDN